jgi:3-oxoacyl-ACP reductase-like protein
MVGVCSIYGERSGAYRVLVGKPEGKGPLGRSRRRWENNIKMDLQEVGCGRINVVMKFRVP